MTKAVELNIVLVLYMSLMLCAKYENWDMFQLIVLFCIYECLRPEGVTIIYHIFDTIYS